MQSGQNKPIRGHIYSRKKRKHTAKHDGKRFALKLCLLKLKIHSSTYVMNISSFVLYWKVSCENCTDA